MKKYYVLSALVAASIGIFMFHIVSNRNGKIRQDLLLENIEALTQNETKKIKCKTYSKNINSVVIIDGQKCGDYGVMYSCGEGNLPKCMTGFEGVSYSNTPYEGTETKYNATIKECD